MTLWSVPTAYGEQLSVEYAGWYASAVAAHPFRFVKTIRINAHCA